VPYSAAGTDITTLDSALLLLRRQGWESGTEQSEHHREGKGGMVSDRGVKTEEQRHKTALKSEGRHHGLGHRLGRGRERGRGRGDVNGTGHGLIESVTGESITPGTLFMKQYTSYAATKGNVHNFIFYFLSQQLYERFYNFIKI
jgi:hypothetical protein